MYIIIHISYHIAGNFHRTLFLEILETSEIFRKFFMNGVLKFFKPVAKREKITKNFKNIFSKIFIEKNFPKI